MVFFYVGKQPKIKEENTKATSNEEELAFPLINLLQRLGKTAKLAGNDGLVLETRRIYVTNRPSTL